MDTITCIETRRSIRKYKPDPVSDADLKKLLDAIKWSPSWANAQPWELVIVDDPDLKAKLSDMLSKNNPARTAVATAPLVFAMCGKYKASGFYKEKEVTSLGDWMMFDLGIACQNLCLAAHALGLGTVHAGFLDHKAASLLLGLPDGTTVLELIPVGHPDHAPGAPKRKEPAEFAFKNKYGQKL